MNFDLLLSTWRDSLVLFKKAQLKLFLLGVVATWLRAMILVFKLFWWLIGGVIAIGCYCDEPVVGPKPIVLLSLAALLYVIIMAVRPSLERKDYAYFSRYIVRMWAMIVVFLIPYLVVFCPLLLWLFFYFDSDGSFRAALFTLKAACKACIYFFPSFAVLSLVSGCMMAVGNLLIISLLNWFFFIIIFIFICSAFSVYYIKLKHQHYNLLFE